MGSKSSKTKLVAQPPLRPLPPSGTPLTTPGQTIGAPLPTPPTQPVWTQPTAKEPVGPAQPFGSIAPQFPFLPPSWAGWRR